jgi:hypothetical protein
VTKHLLSLGTDTYSVPSSSGERVVRVVVVVVAVASEPHPLIAVCSDWFASFTLRASFIPCRCLSSLRCITLLLSLVYSVPPISSSPTCISLQTLPPSSLRLGLSTPSELRYFPKSHRRYHLSLALEPASHSTCRPPPSKSASLTISKCQSMLTITSTASPSSSAIITNTTTLRLSSSHAMQRTRARSPTSMLTPQSMYFLSGLPTCLPRSTSLVSMPMSAPGSVKHRAKATNG